MAVNGNGNGNSNGDDTKTLIDNIKESRTVKKYKEIITKNRMMFGLFGLVIIFQFIFSGIQCQQNDFYKRTLKLNYLSQYNIEQSITKKNRKQEAMSMMMKTALYFNPKFPEVLLAECCDLIYEKGEVVYGIPCEEWNLLITYESEWHIMAISSAGAKGISQLMPLTASYIAKILEIPYLGEYTLFNPKDNLRIGMKYYADLKKIFVKPIYYISGYNYGEGQVGQFAFKDKPLSARYMKYFKDYLKKKEKVEKIIGKKIFIEGLEE